MEDFSALLATVCWGNSVQDYLISGGVFIATLIGLWIFFSVVITTLKRWSEKTSSDLDNKIIQILDSVSPFFKKYVAFWVALQFLTISEKWEAGFNAILIILSIFEVLKLAALLVEFGFEKITNKKNKTAITGIQLIVKIALWSLGILLILSNLGFEISALVASMGIGGIAIALAAQNILGDLFSSFTIYFDKPFEIGDYIIIGVDSGTVEKIGLKSSRIRTLQGEELVVSNKELTSIRIQNFKKMKRRRISFSLGIEYGTSSKKMEKIPSMIEKIIAEQETAEFNRCHFASFGDFSLNFQIVYYVESPEYVDFMNTQQAINFAIKGVFEKEGIEMAFPTQTVFVKKS